MFTRCLNYLYKFFTPLKTRIKKPSNNLNHLFKKKRYRLKALRMTDKKKESIFTQRYKLERKILEVRTDSDGSSSVINTEEKQEQKSPHARFRNSKTLYVTDFASLAWCELQQHYALIAGGKKKTQAMKAGSKIHNELELQVHDIVKIPTYTNEDLWGIKLYNLAFGLDSLLDNKKARELPIFGFESDLFIYGMIDQIEMKVDSTSENTIKYELSISDTKTRSTPFLPNVSNIPPSVKYQLMLYKKLFDKLVQGVVDDVKIFQTLKLDPDLEFSNELANIIKISYQENEFKPNLQNLIKIVMNRFENFCKSSNILEVNYKFQKDGKDLGSLYFEYDENQIENHLKKSAEYWKGDRNPEGVPIEDAGRCRSCEFADGCEWRLNKIEELYQKRIEQKKRALTNITNGRAEI